MACVCVFVSNVESPLIFDEHFNRNEQAFSMILTPFMRKNNNTLILCWIYQNSTNYRSI